MNKYSVSQVEVLTGIKGHTLRVWERRYSFLKPMRTKTNIRFYSDSELRMLLNINILTNNGFRVSKIDKMSEDELHQVVLDLNSKSSAQYDDDLNRLVLSMLELDEPSFNEIFRRHITRNGILKTVTHLIYPFLDHVGILWTANKAMPAQEHFISNLIRQKVIAAIDQMPDTNNEAENIIMFLPENESHEIGLLLAYYIAKDVGFKVYYLGQNVPMENILEVHEISSASALLTMFIAPYSNEFDQEFRACFSSVDIPLFLAGNYDVAQAPKNFIYLNSPDELIDNLNTIKNSK